MTLSRRTTLKAVGVAGGLGAIGGRVFAQGEHEDDERDPETDEDSPADPAGPSSAVRVAHFSPDAPNVDVYVDDDQVLADVAYETVSDYLEVEPGAYQIRITAAGDPETVAYEDEVSFGQAFYTIAAVGELEAETFRPLVLVDAGSSLVRLVHGAPDAPAVDVVGSGGAPTLFENVSFTEWTNYVALPAGAYSLDVLPAANGDVEPEAGGEAPDLEDDSADGVDDVEEDVEDDVDDTEEDVDDTEEDVNDTEEDVDDTEEDVDDDVDDVDGTEEDVEGDEYDDEAAAEPESTEAVATFDVDLEPEMAYTAYAIGYLEDEPAFTLNVTEDGPMTADEEPVEEEPADEEPAGEEPADEEPAGEEPADEEPAEEEPVEEEPAEEEPVDEEPAGEEPAEEEPADEESADDDY